MYYLHDHNQEIYTYFVVFNYNSSINVQLFSSFKFSLGKSLLHAENPIFLSKNWGKQIYTPSESTRKGQNLHP